MVANALHLLQNSSNAGLVWDAHLASGRRTSTQHFGSRLRLMLHLGFRIVCKGIRFRYSIKSGEHSTLAWFLSTSEVVRSGIMLKLC